MSRIKHFGRPVSPSNHLSLDTMTAFKYTVTWGGGMGGSTADYYAAESETVNIGGMAMLRLVLVDGSFIDINPHYIVKKEPVRVVQQRTDITPWLNYGRERDLKPYTVRTAYFEIGIDDTAVYIDEYISYRNGDSPKYISMREGSDAPEE